MVVIDITGTVQVVPVHVSIVRGCIIIDGRDGYHETYQFVYINSFDMQ